MVYRDYERRSYRPISKIIKYIEQTSPETTAFKRTADNNEIFIEVVFPNEDENINIYVRYYQGSGYYMADFSEFNRFIKFNKPA